MPDKSSNIPFYIFYGTIFSDIIRIAGSTLHLDDLIPRLRTFFKRMLNQGTDRLRILHQCKKIISPTIHTCIFCHTNPYTGWISPGVQSP